MKRLGGQKIEYSEGKPKLTLLPLERTAINLETKEDLNTLKNIYESAGWKTEGEESSLKFTPMFFGPPYICVDAGISSLNNKKERFSYDLTSKFRELNYNIISLKKFLETQNISYNTVSEINNWYEMKKGKND